MYFQPAGEIVQLIEVIKFPSCLDIIPTQLPWFEWLCPHPPPNSSVEILVSNVMILGYGAWGRGIECGVGALMDGISAL